MNLKQKTRSDLEEVWYLCRFSLATVAGFSLFINLLMLVPALYMLQLYDRVIPSSSEPTLLMLTLIVVFLFITMGILESLRSQILVKIGTRLEVLLNERLYEIIFKQALYTGGQKASSQLLDDLTALRQFISGQGLFAFFDAPWLPIYLAVMFMFHSWLGWVGVGTAVVLIIVATVNEKTTRSKLDEANTLALSSRAKVNKNLLNAEVIESMGMLGRMKKSWLEDNRVVLALQAAANSQAGLLTSLSKTIRMASQSLILGLGAYLAIQGEISPGSMIAGSILLGRALAPIDQMIGSWKAVVNTRNQYQRVDELLKVIPRDAEKMPLPVPKGNLRVESAVIMPPGTKIPVIKGISFSVDQGTALGIIGPSGAGKSTLARALLGIWPVSNGKIRLDGADVFSWDRQDLGAHIGYLPQGVELFEGSVGENIARFDEIDGDAVVSAAKVADVHEMILRLPQGYDTNIGAGGGTLSAGQRQRVGLARALYGEPTLIILDEPNSNLDDLGEQALAKAINRLKNNNATVVVITHRPNILGELDKLLVLKEGQIAEFGPCKEVLSKFQRPVAVASDKNTQNRTVNQTTSVTD